MKKLLLLLALLTLGLMVGCSYDDSAILDKITELEDNKIYYTTSDNTLLSPKTDASLYGAILISNTYKDGQGILVFDDAVTMIGRSAFSGCSSLTSIIIPDSVTSIGNAAFRDCSSLTSIIIPDSVTSIGNEAFYGCTGELIINSKVVETDYDKYSYPARYGWLNGAKFTKLTIGNNVTSIGESAFRDCSSLTSITIPNSVTLIGGGAFSGCSSLTSITIPDSVTLIGNYAFGGCSSLTSITIGNGVTEIGYEAFMGCTSLTSITIPDGVTEIGTSTFENCSSLTSVTMGNGVTSIGEEAFRGCTSLTSVTIGNGVTEIGDWAFSGCTSLTYVYCKPTTRPSGGYGMFDNNALGRTIYVPTESVVAYKNAKYWKDYASRIEGYDF